MAESIFTLHSTDTNNYSVQKTFSGVNPEATSAALVETAKGFNRLTDNTYVGTKRIDKLNADTEESDPRPVPSLTIGEWSFVTGSSNVYQAPLNYSGDGNIYCRATKLEGTIDPYLSMSDFTDGTCQICITDTSKNQPYTIEVLATATSNYKSTTVTSIFTRT